MYPVSNAMSVIAFAPSLMMSCTIAMVCPTSPACPWLTPHQSIDYSLFLLSRLLEELRRGRDFESSVAAMLSHAGHIVLVSGLTLSACFMSLTLFPIDLLRSIGIGCALGILFAVIVNLTFTPALLFLFPKFWSGAIIPGRCVPKCMRGARGPKSEYVALINADADMEDDHDEMIDGGHWPAHLSALEPDDRRIQSSKWYTFARIVLKMPIVPLIVVTGTMSLRAT